jgi:hypothetical protein
MRSKKKTGLGLVLGIAIGTAIGVAQDNLALWLGVGIAIGFGAGLFLGEKDNDIPS